MHPDYQYSLTRLFRTYVVQEGRYELITPEAGQGYAPPISPDNARIKARELGAKYYLMAEFNQISDVVISSFTMYETETGTKFWSDMMRALTPDDMTPFCHAWPCRWEQPIRSKNQTYTVSPATMPWNSVSNVHGKLRRYSRWRPALQCQCG